MTQSTTYNMCYANEMTYFVYQNGLLVTGKSWVDYSRDIPASASVLVAPEDLGRGFILVNTINSSDIWMDFGQPAVKNSPSIRIPGNSTFVLDLFVPTQALYMIKQGTGSTFVTIKIG